MGRFEIWIWAAGMLFLCARFSAINGVVAAASSSCMMAYNDGGARAFLPSSGCAAQWGFMVESLKMSTKNCQFASLPGHRKYQEDRVTCNLDIRIPYLGKGSRKEAKVDLLAVFDGHGGTEASETAKEHLLDYFLVHVVAATFKKASNQHEIDDESLHEILNEALLRAIHDIDWKYSSEAFRRHNTAGSTASVVLLLNNEEALVANVGDSKVILCAGDSMSGLYPEELTRDHRPDRDDERARIEGAGGFILDWDVPRVNGILAVSRAIGDVSLKRYGVIAEPETAGWRRLTAKDRYLVVASDGVFESLTPGNVCQLVQENGSPDERFPCLPSSSLAYCIVKTALQKGSTDNLSAIVVPLAQPVGDDALAHNDEL